VEQDDKVTASALTMSSTSAHGVRASSGPELGPESGPGEFVVNGSAIESETSDGGSELPASELSEQAPEGARSSGEKPPKKANNVRRIRIERMMSKAELARRANLSVLTIDRVERGYGCRVDTKRKILEALGLSLADRVRVFGEEE
jgi:DNA-binding XRE family transcriptional regulator